jgi:hypothetical protein
MKLCVLQPGISQSTEYADFAGSPAKTSPPPLGLAGFAACTGGGLYRKSAHIPKDERRVLLVVGRDLKAARQATIDLRREGKIIVVTLEHDRLYRIENWLRSPSDLRLFREVCNRAHAGVALTADAEPILRTGGLLHVEIIPPPVPLEQTEWDFSIPAEERRGIFLGSWDWRTPTARHLEALIALREVSGQMIEPVTVFNLNGWRGRRWLRQLEYHSGLLRVIEKRLPYAEYLRKLALHKIVFHLDSSGGIGRIAADALLCRIPCVGGTGAVDRIAFPELCGHGANVNDLTQIASLLLDHGHDRERAVEQAVDRGNQRLSFSAAANALEQLFHCHG